MFGIAATHVACDSCGALTPIAAGDADTPAQCANCNSQTVRAVATVECKTGVECASHDHDSRTGSHIVDVG